MAVSLFNLSFKIAIGLANTSCFCPGAPLASARWLLNDLSSNSIGSSLSLSRSYSFLISVSNFSFSSSCLAFKARILLLVSSATLDPAIDSLLEALTLVLRFLIYWSILETDSLANLQRLLSNQHLHNLLPHDVDFLLKFSVLANCVI